MSLRKFRVPTETVELPNGESFPVRGLALSDVMVLTRAHLPVFATLFAKIKLDGFGTAPPVPAPVVDVVEAFPPGIDSAVAAAKAGVTKAETGDSFMLLFGESLLTAAPELAADIIAMGANRGPPGHLDPEDAAVAALFPITVQVDAIEKIGRLTFQSEIQIRKLMETVITVASGTTALVTGKTSQG